VADETVSSLRGRHSKNERRGMALVLVLWVMVVLCAVALKLAFSSHLRLQVTATLGAATKALYLARAGVERAIAELVDGRDSLQTLADLRESELSDYSDVELADGSYTLFAGLDAQGEPLYGIMDEAAKINVNTADRAVLSKLPAMDSELVAEIVAARRREPFYDLNDLLLLERVDVELLFGEDRNGNGLLDANEDDGDQSWPPDNADGRLYRGLAGLLTTWSAARNVTADGETRININSASAQEMTRSLSGISSQEAESIVEHRKKKNFTHIAELLDVELIVKKAEESKESESRSEDTRDRRRGSEGSSRTEERTTVQTTGEKAFDVNKFQKIADLVTTTDDEVLGGVVNINTAPYEILVCLPGITEAVAREVVRLQEEREEGFQTVADLLDVEGMSVDLFKQVCPHISVRSDVFRVRSFGVLQNGDFYRCVEAVIDRTEEVAEIRYWREIE
jgi:competence ComEA-like helix-hairpin-helix protein